MRRRISDVRLKEHMDINNGKLEDNGFVVNSMEQMSKMFSRSFQKKSNGKGDIKSDIKRFHKTMLMVIIDTPDISKGKFKFTFISSS